VNQRTLHPVFMPLAQAATLVARVPEAIATELRNQRVSEAFIAAELAAVLQGSPSNVVELRPRPAPLAVRYGIPDPDDDFGDHWQHRITSECAKHLDPAVVARLS
jgi:hypothetical protein